MKKITIAIDGFSSCGKSTMARDLARSVGYVYVDTGAMYRAVTLFALRNGLVDSAGKVDEAALCAALPRVEIRFVLNESTNHPDTWLNGERVEGEIRTPLVSSRVSTVAAIPEVRAFLVAQQQDMGREKGVVMDGRDIGTVVFPDAEMKVFVTADASVRAARRHKELKDKGIEARFSDILSSVKERDYADTHRAVSPLRQADDAVVLDNSDMTLEAQRQWLLTLFRERTTR